MSDLRICWMEVCLSVCSVQTRNDAYSVPSLQHALLFASISVLHPLFPRSGRGMLTFMDCINRLPCLLASNWIQLWGCTGKDQRVEEKVRLFSWTPPSCAVAVWLYLLRHGFWPGALLQLQFYFWAQEIALSSHPFSFLLLFVLIYFTVPVALPKPCLHFCKTFLY